jgi:hypothetical protein
MFSAGNTPCFCKKTGVVAKILPCFCKMSIKKVICGGLFLILISTGVMFFLLPPDTNNLSNRGIHHFETDDGTVRQLLAGTL